MQITIYIEQNIYEPFICKKNINQLYGRDTSMLQWS